MPIINLQKRARELGRIRLGQKGANGAPQKLDRFRVTSASKPLLEKVASLYGGEVQAWTPDGGSAQWEVVTDANRLPIMVPPQPVTQWHEAWRKSGCVHRCTGEMNVLTDEPCDPEDPLHQEAMTKPTTRLNVVLRDVEGVGVFRTETHGWNAAMELPNAAEFLAQAGGYVNGWLSLEQRTSKAIVNDKPVTRHFMVPIIEIDVTPAQLMAGKGRVAAPAMIGGPVAETPALAAAGPDYVALAADLTDPEEVRNLWRQANGAGHMTQGLSEHLQRRVAELETAGAAQGGAAAEEPGGSPAAAEPDADGVVDAELVDDDADAMWQRVLAAGGRQGLGLEAVIASFKKQMGGLLPDEATAGEMQAYLDKLEGGAAA
jgi:hypothetical protein